MPDITNKCHSCLFELDSEEVAQVGDISIRPHCTEVAAKVSKTYKLRTELFQDIFLKATAAKQTTCRYLISYLVVRQAQ